MAIAELWELLEQDPPGLHSFFPPATETQLRAVEGLLKLKLPDSYRRFLKYTDGAILFENERILGINPERPELRLETVLAGLRTAPTPLPVHLIPFAPTDDGGVDCFSVRGGLRDHEYDVVFWSPTDGESEPTHESFDEWLFELTELMRENPALEE